MYINAYTWAIYLNKIINNSNPKSNKTIIKYSH